MPVIPSVPATFTVDPTGDQGVTFAIPAGTSVSVGQAQWHVTGHLNVATPPKVTNEIAKTPGSGVDTVNVGTHDTTGDYDDTKDCTVAQCADINAAAGANLSGFFGIDGLPITKTFAVTKFELILPDAGGGNNGKHAIPPHWNRLMENNCMKAIETVYDRLASGLAFPCGYQIDRKSDHPDWLFFSPGRFIDGATAFNANVGIEIIPGVYGAEGWMVTNYVRPSVKAQWCNLADLPGYIYWGGKPLRMLIHFFKTTGAPGATAEISFALLPLSGGR